MALPSPNGSVVLEYLRKYPSFSSRRLADIVMSEIPGAFKNKESCRWVIRYYRGSTGEQRRKKLNPENYVPRISVPPTDARIWEPFYLEVKDFPALVASDAHVPYHDQDAIEMMIEDALRRKIKTLILNGDWWDCYYFSKFLTDPRKRRPKEELEVLLELLSRIRKALGPKVRIIYKLGNHEERLETYLMRCAPEFFELDQFDWNKVLDAKRLGIEIVKDKRIIRYNKLNIIHGHEIRSGISNPINPARTLFLKAKRPTIEGHLHQVSEFTGKAINDDTTTCWSTGCLCDLHPEFAVLNEWSHGYAIIDVDETGFWTVTNRKIVNYRFCS